MTPYIADLRRRWDRWTGTPAPCACGCGRFVVTPDNRGRSRRFVRGHRLDHSAQAAANKARAGFTHTPETKAKLSVAASRPKPWIRGARNGMAGRTGAANPNWRGGGSPERQRVYASAAWKRVRRIVFARDGCICARCGEGYSGSRSMHLHHVTSWAEFPELRLDPENLSVLCSSCHRSEHAKGGGAK